MLINAIYLANQQQTAELLLMIIVYIYTHYVHVASSSTREASLLSSCVPSGPLAQNIQE
jgi:hypothetical protein